MSNPTGCRKAGPNGIVALQSIFGSGAFVDRGKFGVLYTQIFFFDDAMFPDSAAAAAAAAAAFLEDGCVYETKKKLKVSWQVKGSEIPCSGGGGQKTHTRTNRLTRL